MVTRRRSVATALGSGTREALLVLAQRLADDLDAAKDPAHRLALTRAMRAVLRDVEALDVGRQRQARLERGRPATATTEARTNPLDELLAARQRRKARRGA